MRLMCVIRITGEKLLCSVPMAIGREEGIVHDQKGQKKSPEGIGA
jgi:hypothetical protein